MPQDFKSSVTAILLLLLSIPTAAQMPSLNPVDDPRNIKNGSVIPDEGYSDHPYVVISNESAWLCVLTTGKGGEGEGGQHIFFGRAFRWRAARLLWLHGQHLSRDEVLEGGQRGGGQFELDVAVLSGKFFGGEQTR